MTKVTVEIEDVIGQFEKYDDEIRRLRKVLRDLVIAVEYNGPPIDFGGGNFCWEARIPIAFIDEARAALEEKE